MGKSTSFSAYITGCITALLGYFSLQEWALVTGIVCTVGAFFINWYFKLREARFRERIAKG